MPAALAGAGPARTFRFGGRGGGTVGFIGATGHGQCARCNRMRLTADGRLRPCLLRDEEIDAREALRRGAGDTDIAACLARAMAAIGG